jgi:SAM-dependent methyltransferase
VSEDADVVREQLLERWRKAAIGWGRRADEVRQFGMPVSAWMIDHLSLQPGQVVLDLAAGPGDTGFMAAELVRPGGRLICSDASEPMLEVARQRAQEQGIDNVEFKQLSLEWIDLETASVDAVLCRWGLMFAPDVSAAAQEIRRVVRPGGRVALAVWDLPEHNPWATTPTRAAVELGYEEPPDPTAPGMFVLAEPGRLSDVLEGAGFIEVVTYSLELPRQDASVSAYIEGSLDLSQPFAQLRNRLSDDQWEALQSRIGELAKQFSGADGALHFPARTLVAAAEA